MGLREFRTFVVVWGLLTTASAQAELSANVGYVSEYVFRGISQKESSASAGLDFNQNGFYAGVWGADVGDGLETDLYLGYSGNRGDFSYTVGATGYFYTDDFDDTYKELNLSGAYGVFSLDVAIGQYHNFDGPTQDYIFSSGKFETDFGLSLTAGVFSRDFDGEYYQLSYGFDAAELGFSLDLIHSTSDLLGGNSDNALVFGVSKSFGISSNKTE